ncbi:erythromycin esterase family protein [Tenacibaculum geojense]|uniref:Erythromycin esterase family protein n=1 Tax=Tenacibaculum geojense TaxID=915352 RepID=A0ABW3JPZ6_9FLAO
MKRKLLIIVMLFSVVSVSTQNYEAVKWINKNAIKIEDTNPDTKLLIFNSTIPNKFVNAKVFGFGEATHHGKEFFNLKAKFFKYLVKNHNVKTFIMEESFPSESGINEWISGGEGNINTIANNFSIGPWYCKEIVNLLKWMRDYNSNKKKEEQIYFYGMDIQYVKNINQKIRDFVQKNRIPIKEELLNTLDRCVNKKVDYGKKSNWDKLQTPKLNEIENALIEHQKNNKNYTEFTSVIRALNYLKKYTFYVQNNYSQDRDFKMFENVKWIIENESKNGKAFIWAHNEHINNNGFGNYSKRNIYNLGKYLKEYYKNEYYSVGFDFGSGIIPGIKTENGTSSVWKQFTLKKPFKNTYAETLFKSNIDVYFIDLNKALNSNIKSFFCKKNKQLIAGGSGYQSKKNNLVSKKYSEMYDGLIFVKKLSISNSNLSVK